MLVLTNCKHTGCDVREEEAEECANERVNANEVVAGGGVSGPISLQIHTLCVCVCVRVLGG